MRDKVCKNCKFFVKGEKCPICNLSSFSRTWKGLVYIKDPQNSDVAKLLRVAVPGKYCLWVK